MNALEQELQGVKRLGFDTAPIIYFVEANPRYDALLVPVFQRISTGALVGVTSVVSLTEVLVYPLRLGRNDMAQQYRLLLQQSDYFELIDITPAIAEYAADLRARYNLRTPDALQLAGAIRRGCDAFLTNDANLQRVSELRVLTLDTLANSAS